MTEPRQQKILRLEQKIEKLKKNLYDINKTIEMMEDAREKTLYKVLRGRL